MLSNKIPHMCIAWDCGPKLAFPIHHFPQWHRHSLNKTSVTYSCFISVCWDGVVDEIVEIFDRWVRSYPQLCHSFLSVDGAKAFLFYNWVFLHWVGFQRKMSPLISMLLYLIMNKKLRIRNIIVKKNSFIIFHRNTQILYTDKTTYFILIRNENQLIINIIISKSSTVFNKKNLSQTVILGFQHLTKSCLIFWVGSIVSV